MTLITFVLDLLRRIAPSFSGDLPHIATYTRELPVSMTRMYENALDGEHLPWLHRSSFSRLDIIDEGDWGWRAEGNLAPRSWFNTMEVELRLDRDKNRWITSTLAGLGKGTQIWTHAIPIEPNRIKVIVDFYIPKLPKFLHGLYRQQLLSTYAKLYDEDVWMMVTRQNELNRLKQGKAKQDETAVCLGRVGDVTADLPFEFDFNNHPYQLLQIDQRWVAHSRVCPHFLGPLTAVTLSEEGNSGEAECPWHGYRFNVETRECTTGASCTLAPAPTIRFDADSGQLWAEMSQA